MQSRQAAIRSSTPLRSPLTTLLLSMVLIVVESELARADVPAFFEDFTGASLDPAWTAWDGYAVAYPGDTANHASFGISASQLEIGIPGGASHNQWWIRHAAVTRPYEGSGVYKIKMDSLFEDHQQFGLVFESAPGTFVMFMLYTDWYIWAYIERFAFDDGTQYRATYPFEGYTDLTATPYAGALYIRVTLEDNVDPTLRNWKFEWSKDDSEWFTIFDGPTEIADSSGNIGAIQRVGVFAGNQVPDFPAFDATFDYFETHPDPANAVCGNGIVEGGEQCDDAGTLDGDCCSSTCQYESLGSGCSDGTVCTVADACDGNGACVPGPPLDVDDGNVCTDDSCDPLLGAVNTPNTAACDDNDVCTLGDSCNAGACVPVELVDPDDGNACTVDSCDPVLGVSNEPAGGLVCTEVPSVSHRGRALLGLFLLASAATLRQRQRRGRSTVA